MRHPVQLLTPPSLIQAAAADNKSPSQCFLSSERAIINVPAAWLKDPTTPHGIPFPFNFGMKDINLAANYLTQALLFTVICFLISFSKR